MTDSYPDPPSPSNERLLVAAAAREAEELFAGITTAPRSTPAVLGGVESVRDSFVGYQVIRELHRGGQGVVYQAIHMGTKRKVALKVMRDGPFASPRERARFEREMQILAQLNHPHIVQIHDSGSVGGTSFYVMDYISGHTLDFFMASRRWSIIETLRLFKKICEAVNSAHVRGVIHRDLKPSNIRMDADGEPHILDFGLAKVVTGELTGESQPRIMSITGEFIGSLPWASPEQAEGVASRIDIRSDVYSLGVILYQMLTGTFPYPVVGGMRIVMDNIRSAEPVKPRSLRKEIDDEIQTMVLKCLSKERERRYQSGGELARDIGHYLLGEPIEAKRDSTVYVLRKALSRYRVQAWVVGSFFLLVLLAVAAQIQAGRRAAAERDRAIAAEQRATSAMDFLQRIILQASPEEGTQPNPTIREVLDRAANEVGRWVKKGTADEATLRNTIGITFKGLQLYDRTVEQFETALAVGRQLGPEQVPNVIESLLGLGTYYTQQTRELHKAEAFCQEALSKARQFYGPNHAKVAHCLQNLAVVHDESGNALEAERLNREALQMRRAVLGNQHRDTAQSLNSLARVLRRTQRLDEAEALYQEALRVFRDVSGHVHYDVARTLGSLGECLLAAGKYSDAKLRLHEALEMKLLVRSPERSIANTEHLLARLYLEGDEIDLTQAEGYCMSALGRRIRTLELDRAADSDVLLDRILAARHQPRAPETGPIVPLLSLDSDKPGIVALPPDE